jgi:hypothetical protein
MVVASLAFAVPASARTIEVFPGQSIQSAVNSASPGDTILVHAGTYHENVLVTKNRITLKGAGASSSGTVLLPPPNPKGPAAGNGISVAGPLDKHGNPTGRSTGVHVSGFLIKGFRDAGIFGFGADNFVFSHNTVVDNGGYGVVVFDQHHGAYLHNVAVGSGEAGFYVGDSPNADFLGRGNLAVRNQFGFFLRDASHGEVVGNTASGNCMGINVLNTNSPGPASFWILQQNRLLRNDKYCPASSEEHSPPFTGTGIGIAGGSNVTIIRNTVRANRPSKGGSPFSGGIVLVSSKQFGGSIETGNLVRKNDAHKNKPADISWDGQGHNTFSGNNCGSSKPGGLCH